MKPNSNVARVQHLPDIVIVKYEGVPNDDMEYCTDIKREWLSHREVQHHPNITPILSCFEAKQKIYMVTRYAQGGELFNFLEDMQRPPSEMISLSIIKQVLQATAFLHDSGIAHRDIKLENILLERPFDGMSEPVPNIELTDFGLAFMWNTTKPSSCHSDECVYTVGYSPPEVLQVNSTYCPKAVDIFCIGNVLFRLLSKDTPLGQNFSYIYEVFDTIAQGLWFEQEAFQDISIATIDFIRKCMHPNPHERISAHDAILEVEGIQQMLLSPVSRQYGDDTT